MRKRIVLAILAFMVAAIIVGSFMPYEMKIWFGTPLRDVIIWMPGRLIHLNMHRAIHAGIFGIAALLAISLAHSWPKRIAMALAVCALALFAEAGEAVMFHNMMEWPDTIDDALGVVAAFVLSALWALIVLRRLQTGTSNPAASER